MDKTQIYNDIKVNVLISLPGSTPYTDEEIYREAINYASEKVSEAAAQNSKMLVSELEVLKMEKKKEFIKNNTELTTIPLKRNGNGELVDYARFVTNKCKPAEQSINLCSAAYYDMINQDSVPYGAPKNWAQMSKKARLQWHLDKIADSLGGKVKNYEVFAE